MTAEVHKNTAALHMAQQGEEAYTQASCLDEHSTMHFACLLMLKDYKVSLKTRNFLSVWLYKSFVNLFVTCGYITKSDVNCHPQDETNPFSPLCRQSSMRLDGIHRFCEAVLTRRWKRSRF